METELKYQLKYTFSGSMDRLEDWLDANCDGDYDYTLEGVKETDTPLNKLELLFMFQLQQERDNFKAMALSGDAPW